MKRRSVDLNAQFAKVPPLESRIVSRVPCILVANGHTGSGKSWKCTEIILRMQREGTITRLFILSPSASSNTLYRNILKEGDKIYEDLSPKVYQSLKEIEEICNSEADTYAHELECAAAYLRYTQGHPVGFHDERLLDEIGWKQITPKRPSFAIFADDCSHSSLFSRSVKNPWTNTVLRSRHMGRGLGCSIFMVSQTVRSGVPKALRENATHWILIGGSLNREEIKAMYELVSSFMTLEEFERKLRLFTLDKHGYLFADLINRRISNEY